MLSREQFIREIWDGLRESLLENDKMMADIKIAEVVDDLLGVNGGGRPVEFLELQDLLRTMWKNTRPMKREEIEAFLEKQVEDSELTKALHNLYDKVEISEQARGNFFGKSSSEQPQYSTEVKEREMFPDLKEVRYDRYGRRIFED